MEIKPSSTTGQLTNSSLFIWPPLLPRDGQGNVTNPSFKWRLGSRLVVPTVGFFSKFWMTVANTSIVHNQEVLHEALRINYEASRQSQQQQYHRRSLCIGTLRESSVKNSPASSISNPLATVSASDGSRAITSNTTMTDGYQGRRPLITYSNHSSCLDDPLMWGALLPLRWQINSDRHRWSAAAAEICFAKRWHSWFFSLGKTFPIIRGEGIYQPAMDYAANLMKAGVWLHFFPEGKVIPRQGKADPNLLKFSYDENGKPLNERGGSMAAAMMKKMSLGNSTEPSLCDRLVTLVEQQSYSLKWGMARLIIEHVLGEGQHHDDDYEDIRPMVSGASAYANGVELRPRDSDFDVLPEVDILPIFHIGMDDVLPTRQPYVPRVFQRVTFFVRPEGPIRIDRNFLQKLFDTSENEHQDGCNGGQSLPQKIDLSLTEKRIRLMNFLEDELNRLSAKAHWLHEKWAETS